MNEAKEDKDYYYARKNLCQLLMIKLRNVLPRFDSFRACEPIILVKEAEAIVIT